MGSPRSDVGEAPEPPVQPVVPPESALSAPIQAAADQETTPEEVVEVHAKQSSAASGELTQSVFEPYEVERIEIPGGRSHPSPLVQTAAMAAVSLPDTSYAPHLGKEVIQPKNPSDGLSLPQLEAVVYAGAAHAKFLPASEGERPVRRGLMIGDSTGVGKGREIAGIIMDNWNQGRRKAIWVSESRDLFEDAKRDWREGVLGDEQKILPLWKYGIQDSISASTEGILFTNYATLRTVEKQPKSGQKKEKLRSRIDQLVEWFGEKYDGVIVYDEAHAMGNAIQIKTNRGTRDASAQALAGIELQRRLPNARVVYVSATGATEVSNLSYVDRLGLWGQGTPFRDKLSFVAEVSSGGVASMEMVARDLKAMGSYVARSLSFDGVEYDRLEHQLSPEQALIYDKLAQAWQVALKAIDKALEVTGADANKHARSAARSAFWGAHQRFFNQILTSMQLPSVIKQIDADLQDGYAVVLQLVNTLEAVQERKLAKLTEEGGNLEDLDMTPREVLMDMVANSFPTQLYEEYMDEDGNVRTRPVQDSQGRPVESPQAAAMRDQLLDQLSALRVPEGPLDAIINHYGADKVAEVTGRQRRIILQQNDAGAMVPVEDRRSAQSKVKESQAFQHGEKRILIFSEAGATGRSYHADRRAKNQARRRHYVLQPGWRADKAVQGLGRTHRSNQVVPPSYFLVTTDLPGHRRFVSTIARRLDQLGALTRGQRQASQGLFSSRDNLESTEARDALIALFQDVHRGRVEGLTIDTLEDEMGLKLRDEHGALLVGQLPPIQQFLNRLLSLTIDTQNAVFNAFSARLDAIIEDAIQQGRLDVGMETIQADGGISKEEERPVYTHPESGAVTRYVRLKLRQRVFPYTYARAKRRLQKEGTLGHYDVQFFARNKESGRLYAFIDAGHVTDTATGAIVSRYRRLSVLGYDFVPQHKVTTNSAGNYVKLSDDEGAAAWEQAVADTPEFAEYDEHLITGVILPIWDRISRGKERPRI